MSRTLSVSNLYLKKHKTISTEGIWKNVFGEPEANGAWIISGNEKNGKTWFALSLANYLSTKKRILYISAEEGTGLNFVSSCKRAGIELKNRKINFLEYIQIFKSENEKDEEVETLSEKLQKKQSADIIFIDNVTVYRDELKGGTVNRLLREFPTKLFIFLAHEEKGELYTATAKLIKRLSKIIMRIEGLNCSISGRVPGGNIIIDEQRAQLYHGNEILNPKQ